ncbi:segregation/condensation protein A [bacterium]|nr:segregation/condensation protein A [bacterium]
MPYRVRLQNFEGPMDLLLFLIHKNEVDLLDIPVALITRQFLEYVELIKLVDLESASDFILLAATLIRIKAKMLLPKPETEDDEEEEDPRFELIQRLLEYKRFKDITPELAEREMLQRDYFSRNYFKFEDEEEPEEVVEESLNDVSLFKLMEIFKLALEKAPKLTFHRVEMLNVTLEEQVIFLQSCLKEKSQILFADVMTQLEGKIMIIVTFIAILELVRRDEILVKQMQTFGDIWIQKK